jgi:hypothetical protein
MKKETHTNINKYKNKPRNKEKRTEENVVKHTKMTKNKTKKHSICM